MELPTTSKNEKKCIGTISENLMKLLKLFTGERRMYLKEFAVHHGQCAGLIIPPIRDLSN